MEERDNRSEVSLMSRTPRPFDYDLTIRKNCLVAFYSIDHSICSSRLHREGHGHHRSTLLRLVCRIRCSNMVGFIGKGEPARPWTKDRSFAIVAVCKIVLETQLLHQHAGSLLNRNQRSQPDLSSSVGIGEEDHGRSAAIDLVQLADMRGLLSHGPVHVRFLFNGG